MDLETLTRLFATTLSPDPNVRKTGELEIRKVGRRPNIKKADYLDQYCQIAGQEGVVAALLQIISTEGIDTFVFDASFTLPRMLINAMITVPHGRRVLFGSKTVSTPVMTSTPPRFGRIAPRFPSLIVTHSSRLLSLSLPPPPPDPSPSNLLPLSRMLSYAISLRNGPTSFQRSTSSWRAEIFVRLLRAARQAWS